MLQYLVKRLLGIVPVMLVISLLVFGFVHMLPGDAARLVAGPDATAEDVALVRADLGLDRPLPEQYLSFLGHVVQGDFGKSLKTRRPVAEEIGERLMPTVWLTVVSMAWAVTVGLLIGVLSAVKRGRWQDYGGMIIAVSGISFPSFWLGLLLIGVFSVDLGWLPTGGYGGWQNFVLPSLTLGLGVAAVMARFTRSAFIEIFREDYVRTARAKGLSPSRVLIRHVVRNALTPVLTVLGLQMGTMLGGTVLVEYVFNWPGLSTPLLRAVEGRDYPMVVGIVLTVSGLFLLINLVMDLLYAVLDPRVRSA